MKRIAIIGAGISGLTVANQLKHHATIQIFEKSRGVSGRMSTRYADPFQFDHGAQDFTVRDPDFKDFLAPYIESGLLQEWQPKRVLLEQGKPALDRSWSDSHYVPVPGMNALCIKLAEDLDLTLNTEIINIEQKSGAWFLETKANNSIGPFDWVITSIPALQTIKLLPASFTSHSAIKDVVMLGCHSVMLAMEDPFPWSWQAAIVKNSPIAWMAVNSSKPGRRAKQNTLVVQTDNQWAEAHIETDPTEIQSIVIKELTALLSYDFSKPTYIATHRWRYADTPQCAGGDYHLDHTLKLGACGDWFIKGRIEAAFLSGHRLAQKIKSTG